MQRKHLDEARSRNAIIIDNGDAMDLMQGKKDPRSNKKDLDPALVQDEEDIGYHAYVAERTAQRLAPWMDLFAVVGMGNHEKSILDHAEINPLRYMLSKAGRPDAYQGISGWILFKVSIPDVKRGSFGKTRTMKLYRHHGAGGSAPVTKGTIRANRTASWLDADVFLYGHNHNSWLMEYRRVYLDSSGIERKKSEWHVQAPSYKDPHGHDSWEDLKDMEPKPLGAWWMRLYFKDSDRRELGYQFIKAD